MAQYKGASADGFRAKTLMKKREKQKDEIAHLKCKISENMDQSVNVTQMDRKFASHYDAVEQELKTNTIGLVTLDEMKAKRESVIQDHEKRLVQEKRAKEREQERKRKNKEKEKTEKRSKLSFAFDEEEEEEEENDDEDENEDEDEEDSSRIQLGDGCGSMRRLGKNPDVDTSFLPDKARDEEERLERERLRKEWVEMQEKMKDEEIEVTYSYWDGSGHRKKCLMKQGDSIQKFLQQCLRDLRQEFTDLKAADVSSLMYVKEDLIIPHHYTFYDFIVTKARGKSGPLFDFSVYDDVRITQDASIRRDESHAGKVCMRNWYERNKHIFPASRWEPYDAQKKWEKAAPKE